MTRTGAGVADGLLADRYRLVERIAVGGMGEVWRAEDLLLDRVVAVKTLKAEYVGDEGFRERFRAEARHAGRLGHPGIASVHDFGESPDSAWLVMELVEGEPLSGLLRREGRLSVDRALDLVAQTAAALQAAHDGGVVHRDVKPGNLLVRPDGVLKVTDFGIASATDAVPLTQTGTVVGTAYYLSPEQASGQSGSPASDVYSLGVVAYECLAGSRPFPGTNPVAVALAHVRTPPPELPPWIPAQVRALVARALEKSPGDRFADAAEMGRAAEELRSQLEDDDCYPTGDGGGLAALPVQPPAAVVDDEPTTVAPPTALTALPHPREPGRLPGAKARSSRQAVRSAGLLLLVLAAGIGLRAGDEPQSVPVTASAPSPPASPTTAASAAPSPTGRYVDAAQLLGRSAAQVSTALAERGLVPSLAYDGTGTPVGTVSSVEPTGPVALGTTVLVHVVPVPPPPVPVVEASVLPTEAPLQEKALPPGKGNGNGSKGRGNR